MIEATKVACRSMCSREYGLIGLGLVLLLVNIRYYYLYFQSQMTSQLHGSGFNSFCQRSELSCFDKSVCETGRLDRLLLLYLPATPYFYYQDIFESGELKDVAVGHLGGGATLRQPIPFVQLVDLRQEQQEYIQLFLTSVLNHSESA